MTFQSIRLTSGLWVAGFALSLAVLIACALLFPIIETRPITPAVLGACFAVLLISATTLRGRIISTVLRRRELVKARDEIMHATGSAFLAGPDGVILAQNPASVEAIGQRVGSHVMVGLAHRHAVPELAWRAVLFDLSRSRECRVELGGVGTYFVECRPQSRLQLWRADALTVPKAITETTRAVRDDFELLPVSLMTLDNSATILRLNHAAVKLLGNAQPGQSLALYLDGLGRGVADWVADICAGRTAGGSEVLHLKNGSPDSFVQLSLHRSDAGLVTAVLSDASAIKTLEAQFVQSQKMQAIGQLAGGIAHDFNNLLTAIAGHCDLLMLRHDKADPDYADLDQISQNANRAAALVRQLLAFSRKQTMKPQIIDLRDILADLTHLLNRLVGERIVLTFDHDPGLRMIRADRRQLEQVIMNLVVNARDAMPGGGPITITTDNLSVLTPTRIGPASLHPGDYVRVQVRDEGCGIPAEELVKIFEPFFTTKRTGEGTGLGLSTAYGIIKQTGGYIFCDSRPGEGSTFSLYFPAHDVSDKVVSDVSLQCNPDYIRPEIEATVLLVEDEAPVRSFASRALKLQGFSVIEADCAETALALLGDENLNVDVFVTDVVMPGMDGPTWVREALRDRPSVQVIFMSGYADDIFAEGHDPVSGAAFLAKPFSLSDLTALVSRKLVERDEGVRE